MDWSDINGTWWRLRGARWADEPAIAEHGRGPHPSWIGISLSAPAGRAHQVTGELLKGAAGAFGLAQLVVLKESDQIVGMVGVHGRAPHVVEIVYGVAPAWRGRGLATEILAAVTRAAQDEDRERQIELVIDPQNAASIRVAQKCGYRSVGCRHSFVEATGKSYDDLVYVAS